MVLTLTSVMLQQQDKLFHKVHDYSADTLQVGKKLVDYHLLFHSLNVEMN
jgi:hypothetical protein